MHYKRKNVIMKSCNMLSVVTYLLHNDDIRQKTRSFGAQQNMCRVNYLSGELHDCKR